jgi:pimeloyl-ACP methyl ester carboxylesterase
VLRSAAANQGKQAVRAAFIDIDGTRTRYLYEGSANETLLLVHGFGLSADIWAHVLDPLAAHFSVYAPDILGHGFTDFKEPGDEPAPLAAEREDDTWSAFR